MTDSLAPAATLTTLTPGTWTIDPAHTEVGFVTKHAMVTKVRGYFRDVAGEVVVADNLADSTATATIQAGSVQTGNADRDNHLRSPDFFDVANHPKIGFKSTSITRDGDGYAVTGDLTIRGATKRVSFPATITVSADKVVAKTEFVINRKDFGVVYPGKPDDLVQDDVLMKVDFVAKRG